MAENVRIVLKPEMSANYEGELKDGKPNGQGIAYYRNGGRYEGEWRRRPAPWLWQEYYPNGNLRYDGEWANGVRHGRGKAYTDDGYMIYEGEWKHSKPINYKYSWIMP